MRYYPPAGGEGGLVSTLIDRYLTMCDDTTGLGDSGCQIAVSADFKQTWRRGG